MKWAELPFLATERNDHYFWEQHFGPHIQSSLHPLSTAHSGNSCALSGGDNGGWHKDINVCLSA